MGYLKDAITMVLYTAPKGFNGLFEEVRDILELRGIAITRHTFWANLNELVYDDKVTTVEQSEYSFQYYLTPKQRMKPILNKIWSYISELERLIENHHGVNSHQYRMKAIVTISAWRENIEFRALYVKPEAPILDKVVKKMRMLEEHLAEESYGLVEKE